MAGATALIAVAAACQPAFPAGSGLTATQHETYVDLSWTGATDFDAGDSVDHYGIEVNGTLVADTVNADTSCVLTGLAPNETYTISVTAYDTNAQWSGWWTGSQAGRARVSTTYTTPAVGHADAVYKCVPMTDTDGDRLPDGVETNDGVFVSPGATGTDPNKADSDGDALPDGDEVFGTTAALDLPAFGVSPTKKDLLIESDWFDTDRGCGAHSQKPSAVALTKVIDAFAAAPVPNLDGTTGVHVVIDQGQGGALTDGNVVADADGILLAGVDSAEFVAIKNLNFAGYRSGYFHYLLNVYAYNGGSNSSGQAELPGDDFIVSLACYTGQDDWVANTIVHELGHNLGLRHGGNTNVNYKPNYNSVMNYLFQFGGIDTTCDAVGDGVLTYSIGARPMLDENALIEADGVCGPGTVGVDLNKDGTISTTPISADINQDFLWNRLSDFNDWANLGFGGLSDADGAPRPPEIITEEAPPSR